MENLPDGEVVKRSGNPVGHGGHHWQLGHLQGSTEPVSKSPLTVSCRFDRVVPKNTIMTIQGNMKTPVTEKCFIFMEVAPII